MRLIVAIAALLTVLSTSAEARHAKHHHRAHRATNVEYVYDGHDLGGRPSGCPYAFCGCEASRFKFGRIIPDLNLAANWIRKFSRAEPAPGRAAARNHHVMILISHVSGDEWNVHDGNGGRHRIWEHVRSIRGYVVVDPDRPRVASR